MYMDNTIWKVPASHRAKLYLQKRKVRGHLRTRSEGLLAPYTKPCGKKHNMNTGDKLNIVAGLVNCRVAIWHYVTGPWNGKAASDAYSGPVMRALRRHRGEKRKYTVADDNNNDQGSACSRYLYFLFVFLNVRWLA